jgi:hypothetical protein
MPMADAEPFATAVDALYVAAHKCRDSRGLLLLPRARVKAEYEEFVRAMLQLAVGSPMMIEQEQRAAPIPVARIGANFDE